MCSLGLLHKEMVREVRAGRATQLVRLLRPKEGPLRPLPVCLQGSEGHRPC